MGKSEKSRGEKKRANVKKGKSRMKRAKVE
jgi:hypothetical protein